MNTFSNLSADQESDTEQEIIFSPLLRYSWWTARSCATQDHVLVFNFFISPTCGLFNPIHVPPLIITLLSTFLAYFRYKRWITGYFSVQNVSLLALQTLSTCILQIHQSSYSCLQMTPLYSWSRNNDFSYQREPKTVNYIHLSHRV